MSQTGRQTSEFSHRILAASLGAARKQFHVEATPAEREALGRRLELLALDRLEADFTVEIRRGGAVHLEGRLIADVIQACGVTLEPVKDHIEAPFERIYSAEELPDDSEDEVAVSLEEGEPAEALVDGAFDAGEAVAEQLALELDPFPRAPGVSFEGYESGETSEKAERGPFAALSRLKRGSD